MTGKNCRHFEFKKKKYTNFNCFFSITIKKLQLEKSYSLKLKLLILVIYLARFSVGFCSKRLNQFGQILVLTCRTLGMVMCWPKVKELGCSSNNFNILLLLRIRHFIYLSTKKKQFYFRWFYAFSKMTNFSVITIH